MRKEKSKNTLTGNRKLRAQLNNSLYQLASQLCAYNDALKQFSVRQETR